MLLMLGLVPLFQGDFTSVELRDGHVVFQFGIDDEAPAVMITEQVYNTNNWIGVQAKRRGRGGEHLSIVFISVVIIETFLFLLI